MGLSSKSAVSLERITVKRSIRFTAKAVIDEEIGCRAYDMANPKSFSIFKKYLFELGTVSYTQENNTPLKYITLNALAGVLFQIERFLLFFTHLSFCFILGHIKKTLLINITYIYTFQSKMNMKNCV